MKKQKRKKLGLRCRFIKRKDLEAVARIHSDAFSSTTKDELEDRVKPKGIKRRKMSKGAMVALHKEEVVGYILFDIEGKKMYLANVGVDSKRRSRGICNKMIPWLLKRLSAYRCTSAYLNVAKDNEAARRCYKGNGFIDKDDSFMVCMEYSPKDEE